MNIKPKRGASFVQGKYIKDREIAFFATCAP